MKIITIVSMREDLYKTAHNTIHHEPCGNRDLEMAVSGSSFFRAVRWLQAQNHNSHEARTCHQTGSSGGVPLCGQISTAGTPNSGHLNTGTAVFISISIRDHDQGRSGRLVSCRLCTANPHWGDTARRLKNDRAGPRGCAPVTYSIHTATPTRDSSAQQYKPPQTRRPDVLLLDLKEDGSFPSQACNN